MWLFGLYKVFHSKGISVHSFNNFRKQVNNCHIAGNATKKSLFIAVDNDTLVEEIPPLVEAQFACWGIGLACETGMHTEVKDKG